jgi:hypothetical protein
MSYRTRYTLEHNVPEEKWDHLMNQLPPEVEDLVDGYTVTLPWYEHQANMLAVSKEFPQHSFILTGEGESDEDLDMWKKLFQNGAVYETRPDIVWPDFAPGLPVDLLSR